MTLRDLKFFARLPFAVVADLLGALADRIDTKLADRWNTEDDQ